MSQKHPTVIIAAGGTGGHLYPALAIAGEIKKMNANATIIFVGTRNRIEGRVVPAMGYKLRTIWASGMQRALNLKNILFPLKLVVSLVQSFLLLRGTRADVVVGTGGYVSGPVLFSASVMGIPTVLHESNSLPGVTTRMLSGRASKVFLGFEKAATVLKRKDNLEVVGTPTRNSLTTTTRVEGVRAFGLDESKHTLLVVGGSQGSISMNDAILSMVDVITRSGTQLIWQTGRDHIEMVRRGLGNRIIGVVEPFIDKMELAYAAADLVVCRAGATTLAELTRIGKPAILVPYPFAAEDHQTHNARSMVDAGAAVLIPNSELRDRLEPEVISLLADEARRSSMANESRKLGKPDAGRHVAEEIMRFAVN